MTTSREALRLRAAGYAALDFGLWRRAFLDLHEPMLHVQRIQSCFNENEDAHFSLVQKTPLGA